jgi:hypothetical protein
MRAYFFDLFSSLSLLFRLDDFDVVRSDVELEKFTSLIPSAERNRLEWKIEKDDGLFDRNSCAFCDALHLNKDDSDGK